MNYLEYTPNKGFITTKIVVKLYDIVQLRVGYWKGKIAIVTQTKSDNKYVHIRLIENGMDMLHRIKDVVFVNHNTKTAAKSYFELCEKMRTKFVAKYQDLEYIRNNWDTDELMINDITARTICQGADIYITNSETQYPTKSLAWISDYKNLISAILRIPDIKVLEATHGDDIVDCSFNNVNKLYKLFYGED